MESLEKHPNGVDSRDYDTILESHVRISVNGLHLGLFWLLQRRCHTGLQKENKGLQFR